MASWFEQHPHKTSGIVFAIILILFGILSFSIEHIIEYQRLKAQSQLEFGNGRVIRFKEYPPLTEIVSEPSPDYMSNAHGSLVKLKYPLRTNVEGFILPIHNQDNPDHKIFFLGGSTTECLYVLEEKRFPNIVGKFLSEQTEKRIASYNAGVSGNHSLHSQNILLNKIVPHQPDYVVMMHNINDLQTLLYTGSYWNDNYARSLLYNPTLDSAGYDRQQQLSSAPFFANWLPNLYLRSQSLYQKITDTATDEPKDEWFHIRGQQNQINTLAVQTAFEKSLIDFITTSKLWQMQPVLMTQPYVYEHSDISELPETLTITVPEYAQRFNSLPETEWLHRRFNQIIRKIATQEQITLIDLATTIPTDNHQYIYDQVHFNDKGSILVAEEISKQLAPLFSTE